MLERQVTPERCYQFNRAPRIKTTSASFKAADLALDALDEWESGRTPFPMGVGRNGILVLFINRRMTPSARAYAAPFPTITRGALADFSNFAISSILSRSAEALGGLGTTCAVSSSPSPCMTSAGRSTYVGPPLQYQLVLYAVVIELGIDSREVRIATLTCGVSREIASIS